MSGASGLHASALEYKPTGRCPFAAWRLSFSPCWGSGNLRLWWRVFLGSNRGSAFISETCSSWFLWSFLHFARRFWNQTYKNSNNEKIKHAITCLIKEALKLQLSRKLSLGVSTQRRRHFVSISAALSPQRASHSIARTRFCNLIFAQVMDSHTCMRVIFCGGRVKAMACWAQAHHQTVW